MRLLKKCAYDGPVGFGFLPRLDGGGLAERVDAVRTDAMERMTARRGEIESNIGKYGAYFRAKGFKSPLEGQFNRAKTQGLPKLNPLIDLLLAVEMSRGILAGIQDASRIEGDLRLEELGAEETFRGMRGDTRCHAGELVFRDGLGIIASLFQGPDERTKIDRHTQSVIVLVLGVPGVPAPDIIEALGAILAPLGGTPNIQTEWALA